MFEIAEATLIPLAEPLTPEGTSSRAVVHQWIHALISGDPLYAEKRGVTRETLLDKLQIAGIPLDTLAVNIQHLFPIQQAHQTAFTFIDLFAGIGGMRIGFQKAGGRCVFSSEFEKNAQQTYFENHGDFPFGDM